MIDEGDMAKIYAEMLITDQWINTVPSLRVVADTSLVYEPILKKYGYTSADYRTSVEYYLNDPDDFADIMRETIKILDKKLAKLHDKKGDLTEENRNTACAEVITALDKTGNLGVTEKTLDLSFLGRISLLNLGRHRCERLHVMAL